MFWMSTAKNPEKAREIFKRSLLSLPPHKHLKHIIAFATSEYKCGHINEGRQLFERLVEQYPKRSDFWQIFIDNELKNGDITFTRNLFERVTNLNFSTKKMKSLLKRFLEFEKQYGKEEGVQAVRQKAVDYLQFKTQ